MSENCKKDLYSICASNKMKNNSNLNFKHTASINTSEFISPVRIEAKKLFLVNVIALCLLICMIHSFELKIKNSDHVYYDKNLTNSISYQILKSKLNYGDIDCKFSPIIYVQNLLQNGD